MTLPFLDRLYRRVMELAAHRRAVWVLGGVSFAESSFFPVPPDPLLMAMCLARPARSLRYAAWCTLASVAGGLFGYALGYFLFGTVVHPAMEWLGLSSAWFGDPAEGLRVLAANVGEMVRLGVVPPDSAPSLERFLTAISPQLEHYHMYTGGLFFKGIMFFNRFGALAVFAAAFTFLPYKIFTISAGLFGQPLLPFVLASFAGRGLRFFIVAALFRIFGPAVEPWIRRNLRALVLALTMLLLLGFLLLKML